MPKLADNRVEPGWVARLREAGYNVRRGSGLLPEVPDAYFSPPAGFREKVTVKARNALRRLFRGSSHRTHTRPHPSGDHAVVP
jgi:hypothetical protein